jgi:hypothetical protein
MNGRLVSRNTGRQSFPLAGGRGTRTFRWRDSALRQNSTTGRPPRTLLSAWPLIRSGCPMMQWQVPSTVNTYPAIQTLQGRLLTFGARWRRRDHGRTDSRSNSAVLRPFIPASGCGVQYPAAMMRPLQSDTRDMKKLSPQLHFRLPFCLRSACRANDTPALRTHALLPKIRSAPFRRGLLPRDKLGSPSTNRF